MQISHQLKTPTKKHSLLYVNCCFIHLKEVSAMWIILTIWLLNITVTVVSKLVKVPKEGKQRDHIVMICIISCISDKV